MRKCIGCGTTLQYSDKSKLGYTEEEDNVLCERCFKLKNYGTYQSVALTNEDYQKVLNSIPKASYILYITDTLTLDCTQMEQFKKVILVITKKDILPKSVKTEKIINYMKKQYKSIIDIYVVSSKTGEGIDSMFHAIKKYKKLYVVGATNSGKSTLINKLINFYGEDEIKQKMITTSMYPSTTLDKIEIKLKDITLIDTPGLLNKDNIINYVTNKEVKKITPKKEIKPKTCQIEGEGSIIIDQYVRIDYHTKEKNSITIYASNALNIRFASLKNEKLRNQFKTTLAIEDGKDIVISGLVFMKCVHKMDVTLYISYDIKPYIRDNFI